MDFVHITHKWGYPKCLVYNRRSYWNGWFEGTPILGNLHIKSCRNRFGIGQKSAVYLIFIYYISIHKYGLPCCSTYYTPRCLFRVCLILNFLCPIPIAILQKPLGCVRPDRETPKKTRNPHMYNIDHFETRWTSNKRPVNRRGSEPIFADEISLSSTRDAR
jgi:hypothetical protein